MKKVLFGIVTVVLMLSCVFAMTSCKAENGNNEEIVKINILVPDGAPALTVAKLIKENPTYNGYEISYTILTGGASDVSAKMISGEGNMAIIPTNLAAVLYNKIGAKLVTTNVQGLLYLVGKANVANLDELKGQVVYNIGQGATPDLAFKYILTCAGISYEESDVAVEGKVALTYVSSGAELIPLLKQGKAKFGILGEPAVTKACAAAGVSVQFDIQKLWQDATGAEVYGYPQASFIVAKSLQNEEHKAFIGWFAEKLAEGDNWVKENPSEAGQVLADAGSLTITNTLTEAVVAKCNIKTIYAQDAKSVTDAYLSVLYGFNAAGVGGKLPDDDFYYEVR